MVFCFIWVIFSTSNSEAVQLPMMRNLVILIIILLSATAFKAQVVAPLRVDTTADRVVMSEQIKTEKEVIKQEQRYYKAELKAIKQQNKLLKKTLKKTDPKAYQKEQEKLKDRLIKLGFYRTELLRKQDSLKQIKKKYKVGK